MNEEQFKQYVKETVNTLLETLIDDYKKRA